jgi:aminoglycoside phosphotransferase family enzyme
MQHELHAMVGVSSERRLDPQTLDSCATMTSHGINHLTRSVHERAAVSLDEKVQALRSSCAYEECPRVIAAIETHFAWVFLVDGFAYKLKKPICMSFVDLTTMGARQLSCAEELRLNQRISPDIYLGVVALVRRADGSLHVGGKGAVIDWLIKMRRLPSELMLDRAIREGTASSAALSSIGQFLARFYQRQPYVDIEPSAYLDRIASQIHQDRADLLASDLGLAAGLIEAATKASLAALEHLTTQLAGRVQDRRILEAHGDLRPEHICLSDPPSIIDSLEFPADLRTLDVAEELAFLCVECAQTGNSRAGETILESYRQASGDPISAPLFDFYCSRRAVVRAKIVAWHLRDPRTNERAGWREQAQEYLARAFGYANLAMRAT